MCIINVYVLLAPSMFKSWIRRQLEGFMKTGFVRIKALLWAEILVSYAMFVMQDYLTDVWGLNLTIASGILNVWGGISKVLPVLFLFFVDTLLGNFKMLVISSISYTVGIMLIAMSMPPVLANIKDDMCGEYSSECIGYTHIGLLYTGMALLAVGQAGNLVSREPFFEAQDERSFTLKIGLLRISGFIIVALVPRIGFTALQFVTSWTITFGVPAICTFVATLIFMTGWCGPWKYEKDEPPPKGSPMTNVFRVYVAAASKMCISFPLDDEMYHKNNETETFKPTRFLRCLEKAAIIPDGMDPEKNKWRVCSVAQVEEAKIALRLIPVLSTFVICGIVSSTRDTYFVAQAETMNPEIGMLGLPTPILLLIFNLSKAGFRKLACLVLQKETIEGETPREYKRVAPAIGIGLGMLFSVLGCITAAIVEKRRLDIVTSKGLVDEPDKVVPMSMFWLVFQYILLAGLDSFLEESVSEFHIHQSPESMKKYLYYFTEGMTGVGCMCSVLCVYVVGKISEKGGKPSWFRRSLNRSRLDRYYWVLAWLSSVNLLVYIFVACFYRYKDLEVPNNESDSSPGGEGNLERGRNL